MAFYGVSQVEVSRGRSNCWVPACGVLPISELMEGKKRKNEGQEGKKQQFPSWGSVHFFNLLGVQVLLQRKRKKGKINIGE